MRPTYRPHRHQPAPGLRTQSLGSSHKGKTFAEDLTPERLRLEVQFLEPTAKERAAMNVAALRHGKRNPSMMDELDRLLGTKRRGGIDSLVVLMVQVGVKRLPLEEGELP